MLDRIALPLWAQDPLLIALAVFGLLQVLDIWSTLRALAVGGRELNPVVRRLMASLGTLRGLLAAKAVLALLIWQLAHHTVLDPLAIWVNNAIYIVVVINNLRVARMQGAA